MSDNETFAFLDPNRFANNCFLAQHWNWNIQFCSARKDSALPVAVSLEARPALGVSACHIKIASDEQHCILDRAWIKRVENQWPAFITWRKTKPKLVWNLWPNPVLVFFLNLFSCWHFCVLLCNVLYAGQLLPMLCALVIEIALKVTLAKRYLWSEAVIFESVFLICGELLTLAVSLTKASEEDFRFALTTFLSGGRSDSCSGANLQVIPVSKQLTFFYIFLDCAI